MPIVSESDLENTDVIDPAALERISRLGGVTLVRQMIDLFFEHATGHMATLHAADEHSSLADLERAAHSLKTSAGNLGATGLHQVTEKIEAATAASEPARFNGLIAECRTEFSRVSVRLAAIRASLAGCDSVGLGPADLESFDGDTHIGPPLPVESAR